MLTLHEKASVLIEALPYIQRFRGETVVVKFGGSAMEDPAVVDGILQDIAFMACVGMRPVVVHGGGKAINAALRARGIAPNFLAGLRVTDAATLDVVERVLNREVNPSLVKRLNALGCKARALYGEDILSAVRRTGSDPATGAPLDWGFVGDVTAADAEPAKAFLESGITPVITPFARDESGQMYNINADAAAAALATAVHARKLVFLSDVPGLLADPADRGSLLSTLALSEVEELIANGTIAGGMLPKIGGALKALASGVRKTHIVDAALPHSLLLELFTDRGVGTEIVR